MHRNDRKLFSHVIYCGCMRLKESEALKYLKDKDCNISPATYYRIKKEIEESTRERLSMVASHEFLEQHLERLDTLRMIHDELIENYKKEQNPTKKSNILMQLAEIQQFLTAFYDSTKYIMQEAAKLPTHEEQQKKKKKKLEQELENA